MSSLRLYSTHTHLLLHSQPFSRLPQLDLLPQPKNEGGLVATKIILHQTPSANNTSFPIPRKEAKRLYRNLLSLKTNKNRKKEPARP